MPQNTTLDSQQTFSELELIEPLLTAITSSNYLSPTPIQSEIIPHLLAGSDVVGQAQTGTGKTAAFALPLLQQIDTNQRSRPQVLVITPTRELAIQVAKSFETYGKFLNNLKVLPIYGGTDYTQQLQKLKRGVHVIVGTPGRLIDHIKRNTLNLKEIQHLVLDEADEMLNMGFIDDVEWILQKTASHRQIALFSATMPHSIRKIAKTHLHNPVEITIQDKKGVESNIQQSYILTKGFKAKEEALERLLETESSDGMLIFVRTKIQTVEIAENLAKLGYKCSPLNGDIPQAQRIRSVEQLKSGKVNILVATDVAARGLDVERISHVINFDTPFDTEAYIHRIGRTGRAGRNGKAILFLQPRERNLLKAIEHKTKQRLKKQELPSIKEINNIRIESYKNKISETLSTDCTFFNTIIKEYCNENEISVAEAAGALAKMAQGEQPLLRVERTPAPAKRMRNPQQSERQRKNGKRLPLQNENAKLDEGMDRYRIEIGKSDGIRPANIVGAIANEVNISSEFIGHISIFEEYSTVDLPYGMPNKILKQLRDVYIFNKKLKINRVPTTAHSKSKKPTKSRRPNRKNIRQATTHHRKKSQPVAA